MVTSPPALRRRERARAHARRRRRRTIALLVAAACAAGAATAAWTGLRRSPDAAGPGSGTRAAPTAPTRPADAARVVKETRVGPYRDLTVASPAMGRDVHVRLLPPKGWQPGGARRWPTLWLMQGCCDDYHNWTGQFDLAKDFAGVPVLVVMPDGGRQGHYSDWVGDPSQHWETFHTRELPGLLRQYGAGGTQVIAGVSMGGLGALSYPARHPGLWRAAASYSGVVDTVHTPGASQDILDTLRSRHMDPLALWGDPRRDAAVWRAHNPYDLIDRMHDVRVYMAVGDGALGSRSEKLFRAEAEAYAEKARSSGLDLTTDFGTGAHLWRFFRPQFERSLPWLFAQLGVRRGAGQSG